MRGRTPCPACESYPARAGSVYAFPKSIDVSSRRVDGARRGRRGRRNRLRRALCVDARRHHREGGVVLVAVRKAAVAHKLLAEAHELLRAPPQEAGVVHRHVRTRRTQLRARTEKLGVPALQHVHVWEVAPRVVARQRAVGGAQRQRHRRAALPAELAVEDDEELARVARLVGHAALRALGQRLRGMQALAGRQKVRLHLLHGVEVRRAHNVAALVLVRKAAVDNLESPDLVVVAALQHIAHRLGLDAHQSIALHGKAWQRFVVHLKRPKPGHTRRHGRARRGREHMVLLVRGIQRHVQRRLAPPCAQPDRPALAQRRAHRRATVQRRRRAAEHQRIVRLVRNGCIVRPRRCRARRERRRGHGRHQHTRRVVRPSHFGVGKDARCIGQRLGAPHGVRRGTRRGARGEPGRIQNAPWHHVRWHALGHLRRLRVEKVVTHAARRRCGARARRKARTLHRLRPRERP